MCASSLRAKRALARQLRTLPAVRRALEQGAIGFDAAVQIGKVATERTEKWGAWCHTLDRQVAYGHIYARDRHHCTCPVCNRRHVTPHHVRYRSRGGDDTDENVTSACDRCHLGLIHSGLIKVEGPATRLSWEMGRDKSLVVVGREKVTE